MIKIIMIMIILYLTYCLFIRLPRMLRARNEIYSLIKKIIKEEEKKTSLFNPSHYVSISDYIRLYYAKIDPIAIAFCPWKNIRKIKEDFCNTIKSIHNKRIREMREGKERTNGRKRNG